MALSVSSLTSYVIENEDLLVAKSLFLSRTSDLIRSEGTVMTGVKFAEKINILATDAIFQNGTGCTRVSSGATTLTQRQVTVGDIAVIEDICVKTLNTVYMSKKLAKGSEGNVLPFEQEYTDLKAKTISNQLETAIWQGDTTSTNANLSHFDGLIKLIDAAGTAVASNAAAYIAGGAIAAATGIIGTNVKAIVNSMWLALPATVTGQDDVRVFCGWDTFNKFINAFTDQNLFNFAPTGSEVSAANGVVVIPGTNYKLTAVHGLDGTNRLFAGRMSNFFAGVDLEGEEDQFTMMEDQFKDYLRFKAHFKYGVNVAFPNELTQFTLTA
jgi:hypothetical protein